MTERGPFTVLWVNMTEQLEKSEQFHTREEALKWAMDNDQANGGHRFEVEAQHIYLIDGDHHMVELTHHDIIHP